MEKVLETIFTILLVPIGVLALFAAYRVYKDERTPRYYGTEEGAQMPAYPAGYFITEPEEAFWTAVKAFILIFVILGCLLGLLFKATIWIFS